MIDAPMLEDSFIEKRYDGKKIIISRSGSQANYIFQSPNKILKLKDVGGTELILIFWVFIPNTYL